MGAVAPARNALPVAIVALGALAACRGEGPCEAGALIEVNAILEANEACASWVDAVRGRVGRGVQGSFVVWSRRSPRGPALIASALHTVGLDWFGAGPEGLAERLAPPRSGRVWLWPTPADGGEIDPGAMSALYDLYNVASPADGRWLPKDDVFVGVMDGISDRSAPWESAVDDPPLPGPVPLYDPYEATLQEPTWAGAIAGSRVAVIGFPREARRETDTQQVSLGRVLYDDEAHRLIDDQATEDRLDNIPYDPDVEILVDATIATGMSGGGVFDQEGRWIATIVRSLTASGARPHARAVRASFLVSRLEAAYRALPPEQAAAVAEYLEPR